MKILKFALPALSFIMAVAACSKDDSNTSTAITVQNISGKYVVKGLVYTVAGISFNLYDSFPACEKDNYVLLNTDKTLNYVDDGEVCVPSSADNGTWDVRNDSIIFTSQFESAKVQSYDGKTLVLTGNPESEPSVVATTTLEKQ
ncbi:hypothetical protein I5907_14100 [Panacibacter sp. DH6]|uniref:Lipocalin-like domain-containing protein n=1 Tax=Panacibacter microcysteis TaxID=2793269 RepID=A0A931EBB8_9BACT|nr:hypothetical protein [Panacibacter microcysteis]MBG9377371.1 hypothetical protein [Panacibacter microcysteis]